MDPTKHKRERTIGMVLAVSLIAVYAVNSWVARHEHQYWGMNNTPLALILFVLVGFQLVYGLGMAALFARSSIKVFIAGLALQGVLLFLSVEWVGLLTLDSLKSGFPMERSYGEGLLHLSYYAPGLALLFMLIVAAWRLLKFGVVAVVRTVTVAVRRSASRGR